MINTILFTFVYYCIRRPKCSWVNVMTLGHKKEEENAGELLEWRRLLRAPGLSKGCNADEDDFI